MGNFYSGFSVKLFVRSNINTTTFHFPHYAVFRIWNDFLLLTVACLTIILRDRPVNS